MTTSQRARGASLEAAQIAAGELMQQLATSLIRGLALQNLLAQITQLGQPLARIKRQQRVDLFA